MRAPAAFNPSSSQYSSPKQRGFDRTRRPTEESGVSVIMSDDYHHTYMQPPQTANEVLHQVDAAERRFVAGTAFFNYEEFGSLRPGLPTVQIFSREYIGLLIHLLLVGFSYYFFTFGFGRLLGQYLKANSNSQVQAANYVLIWPQALSIFIGLVSDSYPILGYRRKSYMIVGWVISLVAYAGLVVLDTVGGSSTLLNKSLTDDAVKPGTEYGVPFLLVSLLGAFGIQVGWIAAMAAGVEYAQREHLHYRGQLQCVMLAFYFVGGLIGHIVIATVISGDVVDQSVVSSISIGTAALILGAVAFVAIPVCVLLYAEDKHVKINRPTPSMSHQIGEFWKFCHQNVVYRILFFIIGLLFFIGLFDQSTRDAVREWSDVASTDSVKIDIAKMGVAVFAVVLWNTFLTNVSWRKIATFSSVLYIVANGVLHFLTTYEVVRDKYFYSVMVSVAELPRVWLLVFAVILATEISDVGREALTLALGISYRTLAGLVDYTIAATLPAAIGMKVSDEEIALDSDATRSTVITSTSIMLGLNCVAFAFILALPSQKLDAQQLRAFGGYNRFASSSLLVVFVVLLVFNLVANVIAVL